jgi:hypothetical protein
MKKNKSMGTEYQIVAQGTWEQVAESVRVTKEAIEKSSFKREFFSSEDIKLEDKILKVYLVPQKGEGFEDYKKKFIQLFVGNGIKGKLASLLAGKKTLCNFHLTQNNGESTLKVESIIRKGRYQVTISASGYYDERGKSIATNVRKSLEQGAVQHTYKTLDKLI